MLSIDVSPWTEARELVEALPTTILAIDDDQDLLVVLAHRLQAQGFEVLTSRDARNGMRLAAERRPHLILLDLQLPDADGLEVCSRLADDEATSAIPIIVISGAEQPDIVRRCRAAGSQYFLRKPYDPNALLTLIRSALAEAA